MPDEHTASEALGKVGPQVADGVRCGFISGFQTMFVIARNMARTGRKFEEITEAHISNLIDELGNDEMSRLEPGEEETAIAVSQQYAREYQEVFFSEKHWLQNNE